jgi:hypothetical protein
VTLIDVQDLLRNVLVQICWLYITTINPRKDARYDSLKEEQVKHKLLAA